MLCTGKLVKKIVSWGGVFDLTVEQPQLFRKLPKNKTNLNWRDNISVTFCNYHGEDAGPGESHSEGVLHHRVKVQDLGVHVQRGQRP